MVGTSLKCVVETTVESKGSFKYVYVQCIQKVAILSVRAYFQRC